MGYILKKSLACLVQHLFYLFIKLKVKCGMDSEVKGLFAATFLSIYKKIIQVKVECGIDSEVKVFKILQSMFGLF